MVVWRRYLQALARHFVDLTTIALINHPHNFFGFMQCRIYSLV